MSAYPFSVFKRNNRPSFMVSFKDEAGNYLPAVSTRKRTKEEAVQSAFQMLRDGVTTGGKKRTVQEMSLKDMVRKIRSGGEAETVMAELKKQGWAKDIIKSEAGERADFIAFMTAFWDWDTSPYVEEVLRKKNGLHRRHCRLQGQAIALHWAPFFKGRFLGDIEPRDIDAFISHMGKKDLSAARKNVVIKAGTKPLRWAFSKGKIERDPTRGHILFSGDEMRRHILTPTAAAALFRADWKNERAKLGNMLAAVTGMRQGEIQALRFQDLGPDCLYVRGSWNKVDLLKPTKNNEARMVELPFPDLLASLAALARRNPWGAAPDSFVFWSDAGAEMPMHGTVFLDGLRRTLAQIGFPAGDAAKYLFHGWRHFYTSYMINKLDKKLLKSQTGHKTDTMLAHYADHRIEGDREQIRSAQRSTFAGLLPCRHDDDVPGGVAVSA